jgi:hypothetical protein
MLRRQAVRLCTPLKRMPPHSPPLCHRPPLKAERLPPHAHPPLKRLPPHSPQLLQHLMLRLQAVRHHSPHPLPSPPMRHRPPLVLQDQ